MGQGDRKLRGGARGSGAGASWGMAVQEGLAAQDRTAAQVGLGLRLGCEGYKAGAISPKSFSRSRLAMPIGIRSGRCSWQNSR